MYQKRCIVIITSDADDFVMYLDHLQLVPESPVQSVCPIPNPAFGGRSINIYALLMVLVSLLSVISELP